MNVGNLIENFAIWKFSRISKSSDQLARAQEHDSVASLLFAKSCLSDEFVNAVIYKVVRQEKGWSWLCTQAAGKH